MLRFNKLNFPCKTVQVSQLFCCLSLPTSTFSVYFLCLHSLLETTATAIINNRLLIERRGEMKVQQIGPGATPAAGEQSDGVGLRSWPNRTVLAHCSDDKSSRPHPRAQIQLFLCSFLDSSLPWQSHNTTSTLLSVWLQELRRFQCREKPDDLVFMRWAKLLLQSFNLILK